MDSLKIHANFIAFMERTRAEREMTIPEMAAALEMSPEKYKNIIYGKCHCIDIYVPCLLYKMTGAWMWEMVGFTTTDSQVINQYVNLNQQNRKMIRDIAKVLEAYQDEM